MDAVRTETEIVNLALHLLGNHSLQQVQGIDLSAIEIPAHAAYANVVSELLELYPWSFATKRAQLAKMVDPPAFGFSAQYTLPADAMYVLDLFSSSSGDKIKPDEYEIEGISILTDAPNVYARYISRGTRPSLFSESFVTAVTYGIAVRLARLTQGDAQQIQLLEQGYDKYKNIARLNDTAKAGINQIEPPDHFEKARVS